MRHGRAKAARRTLQFFQRTTGLRAPYHVLLDGTFLVAIVKFKIPLRDRLDKLLQHESFTLFTTSGSMEELEKLKEAASRNKQKEELLEEVIQWAREECEIVGDVPKFGKEINSMLDLKYPGIEEALSSAGHDILKIALAPPSPKKVNYFVACQDETILDVLRATGKVPIIRLARGTVLLLENPSKAGQAQATVDERKKWGASGSVKDEEKLLITIAKREEQSKYEHQQPTQQRRTKRKAKEPNPLSCKKPKKDEKTEAKKRRRKKQKNNHAEAS